jgi:excisionase family DNA binding protein
VSTSAHPDLRALTETEACEALGVCRNSLRALRRSGALPYFTVGRAIRYPAAALREFMQCGGANLCPKSTREGDREQ